MALEGETVVHDFLENSARLRPTKVAVVHDSVRATYKQINAQANGLACWLRKQGVSAGDRIIILLENSVEYVISYYGALKAGGVAVPLNSDVTAERFTAFLVETEPTVVISDVKFGKMFSDLHPDIAGKQKIVMKGVRFPGGSLQGSVVPWEEALRDETDCNPGRTINESALAGIMYTSGSSGKAKGVMLSHRNIVVNTRSIVSYLELKEDDVLMVVLPFFYVMGKSLLNTHFAVGGTVVINNRFAFPAAVVEQMVSERVTGFSGVPSTYAYLLHRSSLPTYKDKLVSLRYCSQAGGHMSSMVKEQLLQALPTHTQIYVMYGATEASARLTYVEPERLRSKIDSIGRPIPGVVVKVLDEAGSELPPGAQGELVATGANIMLGYWKDVESTSRVLDAGGYHTGDLGYRDEDGYYYITGRKDSLLKVGGHRVSPQGIEDALMNTKLLVEVAVVGVEDKLLGKRVVAFAVPICGETSDKDILASCCSLLPRHELPSEIRLVRSLYKKSNGKIDHARCLEIFAGSPV